MSKGTEDTATECGPTVFIHEDWDGPPKFCKECKEVNDAGWHEKKCVDCGEAFFVHVDWENPPKLCKECKNKFQDLNLSCTICNNSFVWSAGSQRKAQENGWEQPKKCPKCRDFIKENTPLKIGCKFCQNIIRWSPIQQLMEQSQGWQRPSICKQCKEDRYLLISGALSDFNGSIYVKDEQHGGCWVAVVYRNSKPLAHIAIRNRMGEGRVAETYTLGGGLVEGLNLPGSKRHTKINEKIGEGKVATTYGTKDGKKGYENKTKIENRIFESNITIIQKHVTKRPRRE